MDNECVEEIETPRKKSKKGFQSFKRNITKNRDMDNHSADENGSSDGYVSDEDTYDGSSSGAETDQYLFF